MDPEYSLQDVIRCQLCETPMPPLHCDNCEIYLCIDCEENHLSNESNEHRVVPFKLRGYTTKCKKHLSQICERYCESCDIPICMQCASSREHSGHKLVDIAKKLEKMKKILRRDLKELEDSIYPKYQEIASDILAQQNEFNEKLQTLTKAIEKHGEDLHRIIDKVVKEIKSSFDKLGSKNLAVLKNQEDEIARITSEITQTIADLNKVVNSNDVRLISAHKSRNAEFRRLPPKLTVIIPNFSPQKINKKLFYQQFGTLPGSSIKSDENGYTKDDRGFGLPISEKLLIDAPRIITNIKTTYGLPHGLRNVSCLGDEYIWTCGYKDKIMRLYNLHGELETSIRTKSGNWPGDIAVTRTGDLVYTDFYDRTVNIVKKKQIQTVIKLHEWRPLNVCSTSVGDILVVMIKDDCKQSKVVRYFGSTEKQTIQYNDKGQLIYSCYDYTKYISENTNLDVCVADFIANAIVVVSQAGKLRFMYSGPSSASKGSFNPLGIATDSHGRILTLDGNTDFIHILDKDGRFLRYIDNLLLDQPWCLCVNTRDNLYVTEYRTGKVKKAQYSM